MVPDFQHRRERARQAGRKSASRDARGLSTARITSYLRTVARDRTRECGLVRVGKTYVVQATALDATTLNSIGAALVPAVQVTQFLTIVDPVFS